VARPLADWSPRLETFRREPIAGGLVKKDQSPGWMLADLELVFQLLDLICFARRSRNLGKNVKTSVQFSL
jgi:hypothetical protein